MKPITICLWFGKGGCGKSTSVYALSSYLSKKHQTLAIDMDPQATLSSALINKLPEYSTYHWMTKSKSFDDILVPVEDNYPPNLILAPASGELGKAEIETSSVLDRHFLLSDILESDVDFTFKIIDTPPSQNICSTASLVSATHVICPVATEPAAWEQMQTFDGVIAQVKKRLNPKIEWLGILPTRFDGRNNLDREVLKALNDRYGTLCFPPIRSSVKWREAMVSLAPPWSSVSLNDYEAFTNEVLERIGYEKILS